MTGFKKEFAKEITPRSEDYSQWYLDIVLKAEMMDYTPVKGVWLFVLMGLLYGNICKIISIVLLKIQGIKTPIFLFLYRRVFWKKRQNMWRDLHRRLPGSPMEETRNWQSA